MADQLNWIVATLLFALILAMHDARASAPSQAEQQCTSGQAASTGAPRLWSAQSL